MKKLLTIIIALAFTTLPSIAKVKDTMFIVKNATPIQTTTAIYNELSKSKIENLKTDVKNNVIYSSKGNLYLKSYQNEPNTELYLASDDLEEITKIIKNISYKTFFVSDKSTLKKYNTEYLSFAKDNNFGTSKNKNKVNSNGYREYDPYVGNFKNVVIEKQAISQNNIKIQRTQLKPKCKVKHYANEYVYEITNNTGKDIVINKVASEGFIGLTQIAAYCVIPRGLDFVPVWGIVYGVQTDLEKNKFTRPHPVNETIKNNDTMRVLALSKKADNPIADFYFTVNNKSVKFVYDPNKGEKL